MKKYYDIKEIKMNKPIKNREHIGITLGEVLKKRNMLDECIAEAEKEILVEQMKEVMQKQKISKTKLAQSMKTSRAAVDRLLDPSNRSVTLNTLDKAAKVFDKILVIRFEDKINTKTKRK